MFDSETERPVRHGFQGSVYQSFAIALCALLGLAMIVNTQLGGEGMWFWYTTLFHHGVKLYADLHTPLQPYFVLESNVWMSLVGSRCLPTEVPSLFRVFALCFGYYLILRQSPLRDWEKAVVLAGCFILTVVGNSYRFDDYHVVAEIFILYSLLILLWIARAKTDRHLFTLAALLGVFCGLTVTTRVTDGAALLASAGLSLIILARRRRLLLLGLFVLTTALVVCVVVKLTGDTYKAWLFTTIIRAAGSKGGTGSIFAAPFLFFRNAVALMRIAGKSVLLWCLAIFVLGFATYRFRRSATRLIVPLQLGFALLSFAVMSHTGKLQVLNGSMINFLTLFLTVLTYLLAPVVAVRFLRNARGGTNASWDAREILLALPLAEWASYSAGAAAEPHTGYYAPVAMLLLLVAVIQPFRGISAWAVPSFVTLLALLGVTGVTFKVRNPYYWQNYSSAPMFHDREWYHHPVYGPLYIDRDLLQFSTAVCADMDAGHATPELLSLPYPFPNYFCASPPWHGYVQTFFDTSTSATVHHLMDELNSAPPQWIVYQRQLKILSGAERLYNHGQPLAQRELDTMIMDKIASGRWQLIEKRNYLVGDGWFVIKTHP